jgi:hypothetical protein
MIDTTVTASLRDSARFGYPSSAVLRCSSGLSGLRATAEIDGRVIAHVLDEISDRPHALIEGVDGAVYYVPHDQAIAEARANGKFKPNSFVEFRTESVGGRSIQTVEDLGDADQVVSNHAYLERTLRRLLQRPALPDESHAWSGWLGRYHAALRDEATYALERRDRTREPYKETGRGR